MVGVSEGFPCEGATQLLAELREAVQCFLLRMAAIFPHRSQQLVFLINNYDLILGVLMVRKHILMNFNSLVFSALLLKFLIKYFFWNKVKRGKLFFSPKGRKLRGRFSKIKKC